MVLLSEGRTIRVDQFGRVTLPKGMRLRLGLEYQTAMPVYLLEDEGRKFIVLEAPGDGNDADIEVE